VLREGATRIYIITKRRREFQGDAKCANFVNYCNSSNISNRINNLNNELHMFKKYVFWIPMPVFYYVQI